MYGPVTVGRQLDADLVQIVRLFCRRRKWRHVLTMLIGAVLLILGSGAVAVHLTRQAMSGTPSIGVAGALYAAGALLFAWGTAAGFTRRLAKWLPASILLGVLAVLALVLASVFTGESDELFLNGRPQGESTYEPPSGARRASASAAGPAGVADPLDRPGPPDSPDLSGRVLAAELMDQAELEIFLGPAPADLRTPGEHAARTRSLAIWRTGPPPGTASTRPSQLTALSLTVQHSARRADKLWRGRFPSGAQPVQGLPGGYVRHRTISTGNVTRVRAGRGEWVVALQLRTPHGDDPTRQLADTVARLVDLLNAATPR